MCPGTVTEVCFTAIRSTLVFAGCEEGEVVVWDCRETMAQHQQLHQQNQHTARSPTFSHTDAHCSRVTAIKPLVDSSDLEMTELSGDANKLSAFQMVSVENLGQVVIWTVLDYQRDFDQNLGLAHWGQVRMVPSSVVNLGSLITADLHNHEHEVHAYDISMDPEDGTRFYVGADDGIVIHGSTQADHRPSPRLFKPEIETSASCNSIAFCPFDEPYMLLGSQDGSIRLHNSSNERPLITWAGTVDNEPIIKVIWSTSRPCVFYILDSANR